MFLPKKNVLLPVNETAQLLVKLYETTSGENKFSIVLLFSRGSPFVHECSANFRSLFAHFLWFLIKTTRTRRAERASNLTFSKCLHLVGLNNPRILMTHDEMAVTANIRA